MCLSLLCVFIFIYIYIYIYIKKIASKNLDVAIYVCLIGYFGMYDIILGIEMLVF